MTTVVVDVGNSRIKWGRCTDDAVAEIVSLPRDDPAAWQTQLERWALGTSARWVVTSVNPGQSARLTAWLEERGANVREIVDWSVLPLRVALEYPGRVGIDRLLDAVAANSRRPAGVHAVIVDAGSAVTVDWVHGEGTFSGGAIFPGLRLMANSLHDYTALLPLIEIKRPTPELPGLSTPAAMEAGIYWAVVGGIRAIIRELATRTGSEPVIFLTGGDTALLAPGLGPAVIAWPAMTLEGIRLTAETMP